MQIGDRLKASRLGAGMTLAVLAKEAGVSKSMLSRIERNDSAPTVTILEKIAGALGVDLAFLFGEREAGRDGAGVGTGRRAPDAPAGDRRGPEVPADQASTAVDAGNGTGPAVDATAVVSVVRRHQRKKVIMPWGADYEMLTPDMQRRIEFIAITYPVNGGSGDLYSHEGEECGVVVEGRFRGIVGDEEFVLEVGDSIYYASSIPHRWENAGDVEAKAIWAITPPSFLTGKISQ
jgi:transcriptional regulator with XRE-family HTH domain/mannose-6-phosphate isomerase-like protein (cupin superfamily)